MTDLSQLENLLGTMQPVLHPDAFVFCLVPHDYDITDIEAVGWFREAEGVTMILEEQQAKSLGLTTAFRAARITLSVASELQVVGFTAAFARVLADAEISCNVVAAIHHDHIFVPFERGQDALNVLLAFQQTHQKQG